LVRLSLLVMAVTFIVAFSCHLSDAEGGSCWTVWLSWMTGFTHHGWLHLCLAWNNKNTIREMTVQRTRVTFGLVTRS